MSQTFAPPPSLLELLARQWRRPAVAAVTAARFNADESAVGFACADGTLALAALSDAEPAERRVHTSLESGRTTIRPRRKAFPPPVVVDALDDRSVSLAPHRRSSFIAGVGDGELVSITPRGQVVSLALRLRERVAAIDHHAGTGRTACAAGGEIAVFPDGEPSAPLRLEHELPLVALAFSPDGAELAAAHARGLSLWRLAEAAPERRDLPFAGDPLSVSWSPDGAWLACGFAEAGFELVRRADGARGPVLGYPTAVRSLVWSRAADALATSGAFRAVAWSMAAPPLAGETRGALTTGRAGLVVVEAVAAHPSRDLLAVGYANGLVSIVQIGRPDELPLRPEGGGAVTALAWSADGRHLALGSAEGVMALVDLPPSLFK
jgi:WD40 repeat protein